jgi:SAM-dependent methyltransferase
MRWNMSRLADIISFIERDFRERTVIEPEKRLEKLKEHLFDVIKTYKPAVVVKAGLGSGPLLHELAKNSGAYIVVVEPSMRIIEEFLNRYKNDAACENIRFINGEFNTFPVDYYAADLLITIDYIDFLESGKVADEFRRALQFDGILFIAGIVLHDEDMEGAYDDFMKKIFPLHNDYYLRDDLKTFLDLNEFTFVKGAMEYYETDLQKLVDYFDDIFAIRKNNPFNLIDEQKNTFTELYHLNGTVISEPYHVGVFMRRKSP